MKSLLRQIEDRLFGAADSVCLERAQLMTEAWRRHEDTPAPLRRARCFAHILQHMTLDVASNPVFAGNTSTRPRAWMLHPEHGFGGDAQVVLEHSELRGHLDGRVPEELLAFWKDRSAGGAAGIGHLAVDFGIVVDRGLAGVLGDLEAHAHDGDEARRQYRGGMAIACAAVIAWSRRYAEAAAAAARDTADPLAAECLARVARACAHVPEHPARDLFEGLQAIALTHLATAIEGQGMSISLGLLDRVLARFGPEVEREPDAAADLIAAFLLKIAANSFLGRGSKTQALTVGGADHTGGDRCNALTLAFLEAFARTPVADPHLFLRWHPRLDERVGAKAATMLAAGRSMPLLVNDAPTAAGFIRCGVAPADAWDYCVIGCNELGIPGRLWDSATTTGGGFNDLELLNQTLHDLPDPAAVADAAGLLARHEDTLRAHFRRVLPQRRQMKERLAQRLPTPFTSALMRGAAARGADLLQEMPCMTPGLYTRGTANAVNALAAIDDVVFRRGALTLAELRGQLKDNWPDEDHRRRFAEAPKWGDDGPADRWAEALLAVRRRALEAVEAELGQPPHAVCHVVRSLHHVDGRRIGASADGRRAGEPVGDSLGAVTGTTTEGPTAVLNSVLKVDAARDFAGGYNLNLTLPLGQAQPRTIQALIEAFFTADVRGRVGQELQINCLDAAALRAARADPRRYRHLVVRIAGLSARFVELSALEQEELIRRAECAGGGLGAARCGA